MQNKNLVIISYEINTFNADFCFVCMWCRNKPCTP